MFERGLKSVRPILEELEANQNVESPFVDRVRSSTGGGAAAQRLRLRMCGSCRLGRREAVEWLR
jgi:hypothetical protein